MRLNMETTVPVVFGVLAVLTEEQARARAGLVAGKHNHGEEWAQSALTMASLANQHLVKREPGKALA
jgi:6,7-dimethyl-8-ribityllumazine synthase